MLFFMVSLTLVVAQVNFVAVGDDGGSGNSIAYSYDGAVWYPSPSKIFSVRGNGVTYGFKWVAVGQGNNSIAYSNDGINWIPTGNGTFSISGNCVCYGAAQGQWVAGGQGVKNLAHSLDGITWISVVSSPFTGGVNGVAYSDVWNKWVATGYGGATLGFSSDGASWVGLGSTYGTSVTYANNMFVTTGSNPGYTVGYSIDGSSFNAYTHTFANISYSAAYGQGKWILVCMPKTAATPFANSTDGIHWTPQPRQTAQLNIGYGIVYSSILDLWIAVGQGNQSSMTYSRNGTTWTYGTNVFNVSGYGVATYSNTISTNVSHLVTHTVTIPLAYLIYIQQRLSVLGNLTVNGNWVIGSQGNVDVSGSLNINGNTTFTTNSSNWNNTNSSIVTSDLNVGEGASLSIVLDANPGIGNTITVQLLSFTTPIQGTFVFVPIQTLYLEDPNECIYSRPIYSATSLSIAISVVQCNSAGSGGVIMNNGGSVVVNNGGGGSSGSSAGGNIINVAGPGNAAGGNGSSISTVSVIGIPNTGENSLYSAGGQLPTGAIVGIAIGALLVATALMVLLAYIVKIRRKKWVDAKNAELRQSVAESLKPSPGVNLHFGEG